MIGPLRFLQKSYGSLLAVREELRLQRLSLPNPVLLEREELPLLLNLLMLRGEGAEIGVQRATFSRILLDNWRGARLHSIDPWRNFSDPAYVDQANVSDPRHEEILRTARERLARFGDRSKLHRQTSEEAAPGFADASLDFAYIDAQHHYEAVRDDLNHWYPKIKPGGVLAGHDYLDGEIDGDRFGVKQAVDEFVAQHGLTVGVTLEIDFPTWFFRKPLQ